MDFSFTPYLPLYLLLFLFWFIGANRQIMFWLYLWQLKEYHCGRFLDHFSTVKGKSLLFNKLRLLKIFMALAAFGIAAFTPMIDKTAASALSSRGMFNFSLIHPLWTDYFIGAIFLVFFVQAAYAIIGAIRLTAKFPVLTKKSLLLIGLSHLAIFLAAIFIFGQYLGEMSLSDLAIAALLLLILDIFLPLIVALIVLLLQPFTVWQKNKIVARARSLIRSFPNLNVIAITGSYGKTVTKELLAAILSKKFTVLKTRANQNTEVGVSQTVISELKPDHQIFIAEIGAVHKGRIKQIAAAISPKVGLITGINSQHQAIFGSQENIIQGKCELTAALPETGTAILNWDSPLIRQTFERQKGDIKAKKIILAGKDIYTSNLHVTTGQVFFTLHFGGQAYPIVTNARGQFMVESILLAAAGALSQGMGLSEIAKILNQTDFTPHNIKVKRNSRDITVISSTYSANPTGVLAHLDYLRLFKGKKAIIMPSLIELGKSSKEVHQRIGQKIAQVCNLAIITTRDYYSALKSAALRSNMPAENILLIENPKQIAAKIKTTLQSGDTLLLEGRISFDLNIE